MACHHPKRSQDRKPDDAVSERGQWRNQKCETGQPELIGFLFDQLLFNRVLPRVAIEPRLQDLKGGQKSQSPESDWSVRLWLSDQAQCNQDPASAQ